MRQDVAIVFAQQLQSITDDYLGLKAKSIYNDLSDLGEETAHKLIAQSRAAIERASGSNSVYSRQVQEILSRPRDHDFSKLAMILGVVQSLSADIQSGYLANASDLSHAAIYADFIEMAENLQEQDYKDAAAVIAGGALESHLRQLCLKYDLSVEIEAPSGVRPKTTDALNSELGSTNIISKLDQKSVTAWLDLRNKAAHARYDEYEKEQVSLMIAGIRDFLTRHPA